MIAQTVPTIEAPRPPDLPSPRRFPLIATIAPLVVSFVLFAVTRSAYTLVFAALGPVVAVASTADAALARRRANRREAARFAADATRVGAAIDHAHTTERRVAAGGSPSLRELIASPGQIAPRWRGDAGQDITIRLGVGAVPSTVRYNGTVDHHSATLGRPRSPDPSVEATLASLGDRVGTLQDAPILGTVASGIGVVGRALPVEAVARAVILQLAATLSPADWSLTIPADSAASWLSRLPHRVLNTDNSRTVRFFSSERAVDVVTAPSVTALPREVDIVLELRPDGTVLRDAVVIHPEFLGAMEAAEGAAALAELAERVGIRPCDGSAMPDSVDFGELQDVADGRATELTGLAAAVGVGFDGPVSLDLVADGPHAVVGGTTGSGKSELLLSWVLGIAARRAPSAVTFLFVDFKGGASFGSLLDLPHSVGLLTDLDAEQPLRALASLGAELRYRERLLAAHELRSVDQTASPPFPRLVVVVDEYAALLESFPTLHALFTDIAARGRSLGVHLVLCTQRPSGVVRDGILANCPMRISLRVTSAADSTAVVGTVAAAELPARPRGRALLSLGGGSPAAFQVAMCSPDDVARVVERWAHAPRPRAPWLPPLGSHITMSDIGACEMGAGETGGAASGDEAPFALADLPDEQAQKPAHYRPREQGSLLVVGTAGSGKSGVLATLAAAPSSIEMVRVASSLPCVWDALAEIVADGGRAPRVLLFDDLDAIISACPDGYQSALIDLATRALREGPAAGTWCVLTAQRMAGAMHSLAALCGGTLVLRMPNRAEYVLAGGEPATFVQNLPPGAGHWRGRRIQVAIAPAVPAATADPRAMLIDPTSAPIVGVSSNPERFVSNLRELAPDRRVVVLAPVGFRDRPDELTVSRGGQPPIVVADPDAWQSQWTVFGSLQRESTVLFDGISLGEFRALTRSRDLPPPFAAGERTLWAVTPEKELGRARLVQLRG
jgi:S-DNA-T family DNA segregation ATPase FtsK/SpoIIIE